MTWLLFAGLVSLNANYEVYKDFFWKLKLVYFFKAETCYFRIPGDEPPISVTIQAKWNQQQALNIFNIY